MKLEMANWGVNFSAIAALVLMSGACGPSPRPVPALPPAEQEADYVPDQPRVAWTSAAGSGLLAPVESRGPAFFATTTNRMVVAVAAESGRRFWYQRFDSPINTGIAIENGRLYFATASLKGEAFALDATRGRKLWSRRIGSTLLRPVIVADQVIFATEQGTLVSLSKQSGGEKWQRQLSGRPVIQPTLVGDRIVTATTADSIYTFDVKTGDVLQRGALPGRPSAAPLIVGDTIYLALLKPSLVAVDAQSLRVLFERKLDASALAAPQAIGNSVYVLTRNAEVFKLDSQGLQRIASLGSAASGSFNAVGSRLIAGLLDGRVVALDESGQQVWQYQAARSIVVPVTPVPDGLLVTLKNGGVLKLK